MVRVLREREFRLLWFGQSASTIGDRLVFVALALYVTEIGTPTDVGIVLAAHAIPFVGCLLLGGVWADRLPRHRVMVATDLIRATMHALLAALIFTGAVEIWHIVVIEAVFGAAEAFFRPAFTGLVPQTVPEPMLQEANAANSVVQTVAEFAGPALATALVLGVGAGFRWRPERPLLAAFVINLAWPVAIALFAVGVPLALLAVVFVVSGAGLALFDVWWQTALAQRIPPHALSRVSSYDWMGSLARLPLGYLLAGPLGQALGNVEVVIAGGVIAFAVALLGFAIPDVWHLRSLEARG